jgi:hypothetical protein
MEDVRRKDLIELLERLYKGRDTSTAHEVLEELLTLLLNGAIDND